MNSLATSVMARKLHRSSIAACLVYFREIDPMAFWEFCNSICHFRTHALQQSEASFGRLVGNGEHTGCN
jgi:hypothetical protein